MYYQYRLEVALFGYLTDSRAGTVTGPLSVHYYSGKAALIRATGCIQAELDLLGFDNIHLYALHPGGCKTGLQSSRSLSSRLIRRAVGPRCRGRVPKHRRSIRRVSKDVPYVSRCPWSNMRISRKRKRQRRTQREIL